MTQPKMENQGWKEPDLSFAWLSGPVRYSREATGRVQYVRIANDDATLGFIWFSDSETAAHFLPRSSAGTNANNAAVVWGARLAEAKKNGLRPSEAVSHLSTLGTTVETGSILHDQVQEAASLEEMRRIAAL